jgi:hypothetical protein
VNTPPSGRQTPRRPRQLRRRAHARSVGAAANPCLASIRSGRRLDRARRSAPLDSGSGDPPYPGASDATPCGLLSSTC